MLRALLKLVASNGTLSTQELANRLAVPPALVDAMLEALVRDGRLKAVTEGCPGPCERCPLHALCIGKARPRIWVVVGPGPLEARRDDRCAARPWAQ